MDHSFTLELFAREQIGDWRREADRHRLVRPNGPGRLATWPLVGRLFQLVVRMVSAA